MSLLSYSLRQLADQGARMLEAQEIYQKHTTGGNRVLWLREVDRFRKALQGAQQALSAHDLANIVVEGVEVEFVEAGIDVVDGA